MARTPRPDLMAQPYRFPEFIGGELMPAFPRSQKTGTIYYQDIQSDGSAQTDRTLAQAPTATSMTSSSTTWTAAEKIYRAKADNSEIAQLGGLAIAQSKMARKGKRAVMSAVEDLVVAATLGNSSCTKKNILNSAINAVQTAVRAVRDYADGRVALFGQRATIERLKRYTEIKERMAFTGVQLATISDARAIADNQLGAILGVDVVLGGPATNWGSTYDEYLGVMVLPDPNLDPDEVIQFGRTATLSIPVDNNPGNIFQVETWESEDLIAQVVDTQAWVNAVTFNYECLYLLTGFDELNASSTTTTTT